MQSDISCIVSILGYQVTTIDSSCTAGSVIVSGLGVLVNNGSGLSVSNSLVPYSIFNENLAQYTTPGYTGHALAVTAFCDYIWINTSSGYTGTTYPVGTQFQPVNNITEAKAIAIIWGLNNYKIKGNVVLNSNHSGWTIKGLMGPNVCSVDVNDKDISESLFDQCTIVGQCNGRINTINCTINNMTDVEGYFLNSYLQGYITLKPEKTIFFLNGFFSSIVGEDVSIDMNEAVSVSFAEFIGNVTVINLTDGKLFYRSGSGITTFNNSCVDGTAQIDGIGKIINNGLNLTLIDNTVPSSTYDTIISQHTESNTFGKIINDTYTNSVDLKEDTNTIINSINAIDVVSTSTGNIVNLIKVDVDEISDDVNEILVIVSSTGAIEIASTSIDAIANAVWDEPAADHAIPDTMGKLQNTYRIARFVR